MKDQDKTKEQLINELEEFRRRIGRLETLEAEHLRAEKLLRQAEEEKQAILDSLLEHVVYHDMEMRVLWANRAACESAGKTLEELEGRYCYEVWAKRSNPCTKCPVKRARKTGHPHALEKKTPDGRFWYIQASPVIDTNGDIVGMVELTLEITERKRAEEELRESEERYRALAEQSLVGFWQTTLEGYTIYINPAMCAMLEIKTPEELSGKTYHSFYDSENLKIIRRELAKRPEGISSNYEVEIIGKNGRGRNVMISGAPIFSEEGKLQSVIGTFTDTTERKRAEEALRKSRDVLERRVQERTAELLKRNEQLKREIENRKHVEDALRGSEQILKVILAASPVGICLVRNRIIDWTNQAMYRIWGYQEGSLLGKSAKVLYPDVKEYKRVGDQFYSEIEHKGAGQVETRWVTKDGRDISCYLQGCSLDPSDISKGVIVAAMDITEHKQAEKQIQTLSQQLIHAQERERQMISYELHDSIAQNLSALKISCETFFDGQSEIPPELSEKRMKLSKLIEQTLTVVRNLAYDLRPPGLDEMGLIQAIEMYCEEFSENSGVKVDFQPAGIHKLDLGFDAEIHLYRLVQEGLNNIRKHADAEQATVKLIGIFPNIILRIEDNGKGFDVKARELALGKEKRMGLRSMKERVNLLGGQMTIQSRPMQGTKVFIKIPYKRQKDESKKKHINH